MIDILEAALSKLVSKHKVEHADIRLQRIYSNMIVVTNGKVERIIPSIELAGSVRVLKGTIGLSIFTRQDKEAIGQAAERATKIAEAASVNFKEKVGLASAPQVEDDVKLGDVTDPREVPIDEKKEIILSCDAAARSTDERIVGTNFRYIDEVYERFFVNSDGSKIQESHPYTELRTIVTAREGARISRCIGRIGASAGQELMAMADPLSSAQQVAKDAVELLSAEEPPSGKLPAILDPRLTGLLASSTGLMGCAHNALIPEGELGGFAGRLGEQLAPESFVLYDDPTSPGLPVFYKYDEEGVLARPTTLIENGVLKSYLHSKTTAYLFNTVVEGHARCQNALFAPRPYVSNTIVKSGDLKFEEMVEGIKDGIYLTGLTGASTTRIMSGNAERGYLIKNGKLGRAVLSPSFTLDIVNELKNIDGVGSDFEVLQIRLTEEEESMVTSGAGPHLRFSELRIG
ncbi:MAG: TldD/PmbA family protein [Promethearchaeati archaeon SRVP18_Atabeyarchaeia-1]